MGDVDRSSVLRRAPEDEDEELIAGPDVEDEDGVVAEAR